MTGEPRPLPPPCPRCDRPMRADLVKTAIWQDEDVIIVEDVPAQVCDHCVEQFYDDLVTDTLRVLTEQAFSSATPDREIVVPVFSLKGRVPARRVLEEPLETY